MQIMKIILHWLSRGGWLPAASLAFWNPLPMGIVAGASEPPRRQTTVRQGEYHGWKDALFISNGIAEAVVVPAIGRVMQFGFAGEAGVFWENRSLDGQAQVWIPQEWLTGNPRPAPPAEGGRHPRAPQHLHPAAPHLGQPGSRRAPGFGTAASRVTPPIIQPSQGASTLASQASLRGGQPSLRTRNGSPKLPPGVA